MVGADFPTTPGQLTPEWLTYALRTSGAARTSSVTSYDAKTVGEGVAHCLDVGCLREKLNVPSGERHELCRGLHAEQNAIIQAAKHGTNIEGATLYCTNQPCGICAKMIINAGVKQIVFEDGYPDALADEMIKEAGVETVQYRKDEGRGTRDEAKKRPSS